MRSKRAIFFSAPLPLDSNCPAIVRRSPGSGPILLTVGEAKESEQSPTPSESDAVSELLRQVNLLIYSDQQAALELLAKAIEIEGPRSDLLWPMAQAHFWLKDYDQALKALDQAFELDPSRVHAFRERITMLDEAGLVRQALTAVEAVPSDLRDDPGIRLSMWRLYTKRQFFANALALGRYDAPPNLTAVSDRILWYTVGPLLRHWPGLRRRALNWEEINLLYPARRDPPRMVHLEQASGLTGNAVTSLRASLDEAELRLTYRIESLLLVRRWLWRIRPCIILGAWPVLWFAATLLPRANRPGAIILPTLASAAVAVFVALLVSRQTRRAPFWWRATGTDGVMRVGLLFLASAGAVEAYLYRLAPSDGWQFWTVYGLITAPAVTVLMAVVMGIVEWRMFRNWRNAMRRYAHFDIIDDLLWLLDRLHEPGLHDAAMRLLHARALDEAANKVEEFLLPAKSRGGLSENAWLDDRAKGWAEALRHLERALIAENFGQSEKIERILCHQIRCLATGRLGSLTWRAPRAEPKRRLKVRLFAELRTALVALLPLVAVTAAHLFVHIAPGVLTGALLTAGAWAVLTLMIRLDPDLDKKLATADHLRAMTSQRQRDSSGDSSP